MKFGTKVIHAGQKVDDSTGAIMTPIYQTSTFAQSEPGKHKGYEYSRTANPTRNALQENIAALENGKYGLCFSSGLAATDAIIKLLLPGDEIISTNDLYGGTFRLFDQVFKRYGIKFHFTNLRNKKKLQNLVNKNTKLIWIETPTNPMMHVVNITDVVKIAKSNSILVCVDNTFSSPYLQTPLDLGANLVIHSATKYLSGHSDVILGALATNSLELMEKLAFIQNSCGAIPGPQDCFLTLRGIKTLHIRMERHCENASIIVDVLRKNSKIANIYYPGLKNHPDYTIAKEQMKNFGGMISFSLKNNRLQDAIKLVSSTKIFTLAESLGGVESLIGHPATMTHASIPKKQRIENGIVDSLIRLSVGIEDIDDLSADLLQALSKI